MDPAEQEAHTCLNCGAALSGPYCAACGQPDSETNITLRGMLAELAEDVLNWDSRFLTSVRQLLLKPGFLTTEYLAGHRARHAPPFRLFLLGSVLFLAAGGSSSIAPMVAAGSGRIEVDTAGAVTHSGLLGRIERGSQVLNHDPERTKRLWFHSFVWALFLLVPIFALLLRLVFAGGGVHYPGHLWVAKTSSGPKLLGSSVFGESGWRWEIGSGLRDGASYRGSEVGGTWRLRTWPSDSS
jgi:hypothetical protein